MRKNVLMAFIFSLCSFSYQFLIIKIISEIMGDSFLWRSFFLSIFILGLGFGSYILDSQKLIINPNKELFKVEKKIIFLAILAPSLLFFSDILSNIIFYYERFIYSEDMYDVVYLKENMFIFKVFFICIASIVTFQIGKYTGKEMPLLIYNNKENKTNLFLFFNYLGSLFSSVLIVLFLYSLNIPVEISFLLLSIINLTLIFFIEDILFKDKLRFILLLILLYPMTYLSSDYLKKISLYQKYNLSYFNLYEDFYDEETKIIESITPYQKIDFIVSGDEKNLYLNGNFQFSIGKEKDYHETMVHLPLSFILDKEDKINTLLLGGGDGFLLRELFKYDNLKLKHIELDENFLKFSKNNKLISQANNYSLDKEVDREFIDGLVFLKNNKEKKDFILIDFPYPYSYDLAKLYSKEFFTYVKNNLEYDGIAVMDIPLFRYHRAKKYKNLLKINNILYSTIKEVFDENCFFFKVNEEGFVLLSKKEINLKNIDLSRTKTSFKSQNLNFLKKQDFNFEYNKKLINSIYKPTILDFSSLHSKY